MNFSLTSNEHKIEPTCYTATAELYTLQTACCSLFD
jgi:hypothetical protein